MSSGAGKSLGYRADIDGLRAVAVLSVVLYHIKSAWLPGGYVGVDIFFVISGFLITRNIWGELQSGHFSLTDFYLRRIRRIAPAFLVVTAATLVAGALLLLPADLLRLAKSAIWASFSAANIYYWKHLDTDYFAAATAEEPLLHMWSLGVEEQFYLVWPALLMALALAKRARPVTIAATVAICIGSFAIAELTNASAQKFAYYMLPTRAGELMLGALLAFSTLSQRKEGATSSARRAWLGETASVCGIALIGFSLWWLDDASPFPGINAIYPCLGAVLLIFSGQQGSRLTRAMLTPRPVVYVGLISYSLYLWHWPILAFIRYFYGEVSLHHAGVALVLMLALSVATYRLVEQPARRLRVPPLKQVVALLVGPVVVISLGSIAIVQFDGMKAMIETSAQFRTATDTLNRQTSASSRSAYPCTDSRSTLAVTLRDRQCVLGARKAPSVFLWGDSNAAHYIGALKAVAEHNHFAFRYAAFSTCPPLFGAGEFGAPYARDKCGKFREGVRQFLTDGRIKTVVLAGQWAVHNRNPQMKAALNRTINEITSKGMRVVLLGQVPAFAGYTRECELRWVRVGTDECEERSTILDLGDSSINVRMAQLAAKDPAVSFVDARGILCREERCSPYVNGTPVYYNPTHLSSAGSYLIGQKIAETVNQDTWSPAFSSAIPPARAVLVGGYQPGFPYKIRSQRHTPERSGRHQHVVIAEYLEVDGQAVADDVTTGLAKRRFTVRGPIRNQTAMRYLAHRGPLSLTIDIHAQPVVPLVAAGARGIVSFAWKDRQAR